MHGLSEGFEHFLVPDDALVEDAVVHGLVVLDTNVLLDGYRFHPATRDDLFGVLERLGERLWIPHQVALEFFKNRLTVMASLDTTYQQVIDAVTEHRAVTEDKLGQKIRTLVNRVAIDDATRDLLLTHLTDGFTAITDTLEQLRQRHDGGLSSASNDPVLHRLDKLLAGKVGPAPSGEESAQLRAEAGRRVAEQVPPGFQDRAKPDSCGDYIVWAQSLQEARRRGLPLLFVTSDDKGDWFLTIKGRTMCALPALQAEARQAAGVPLVLAQPQTLLWYARRYLDAPVSDATVLQASDSAAPPAHRIRELVVHRLALFDMINVAERELRRQRDTHTKLTVRRDAAMDDMTRTTRPGRGPLDDTRYHLDRQLVDSAERVRRIERILALLNRPPTDVGGSHVRITWHGFPSEEQMEDFFNPAEGLATASSITQAST
ncbi:PIN-like domain-containing protein [Dactylosporangium sp. McL0621]|uniref:PIN-like domain-containing protein n=1 Tax=Dactylosporangium sp. McL0621 TaxID=3415678 RepID=UPI003CE9E1EB